MANKKFDIIDGFNLFLINVILALTILTVIYGKMALVMVAVAAVAVIITCAFFVLINVLFGINIIKLFKLILTKLKILSPSPETPVETIQSN